MASPPRGAKWEGGQDASGLHVGIVVSRYNEGITRRLLDGAQAVLAERGAAEVDVVWVPGAFEIPLVARRLAATGAYDVIITLGCVIKGETAHFEHVSREAAAGVAHTAYETGVPIIYEVLAVYDPAQAAARSGGELNRGRAAAAAAIEMATLLRRLSDAGR